MHYAGVGCEMDAIMRDRRAARPRRSSRTTRTACSAATAAGRSAAFGALATLSFHETKNVTCGEGGALLINDPALVERAEILREKGTNRSRFFRGQVDKYTWVDVGSSYLPSDLLAAFLLAQLEARDDDPGAAPGDLGGATPRRWRRGPARTASALPIVPAHCEQPAHMFYLLLPSLEARTALIAHLRARRILPCSTTCRCTSPPMGRRFGGAPGSAR